MMQVSHETSYQALFVQGRGGPVSLIWPHRDGLIWPHLRHAGDLF